MDFLGLFDPLAEDTDSDEHTGSSSALNSSSSVLDSCSSAFDSSSVCSDLEQLPDQLPPEPQLGNIEYKLKLVSPSWQRFQHLVTQMKWRLREGQGEAIYELGVADCGALAGLSPLEMAASVTTVHRMAAELGAAVTLLRERRLSTGTAHERCVAELLIRKVPDDRHSADMRLAVLGNADVGKSTLLGVLTQGQLDNGRGRSRLNMLRHRHEIQTGRTSSISHEILGFDSEGNTVDYSATPTAEEICEQSSKLVTFIDLAGHHKYLKTTVCGLTGYSPHRAMLVVSANSGVAGTTGEHLALALALRVPLFVVVTKIDLTSPARLRHTLLTLESVLRASTSGTCPGGLVPLRVTDEASVAQAAAAAGGGGGGVNGGGGSVVPVFSVSSVTGAGLPLLKKYLHALSPGLAAAERQRLEQQLCKFHIDETFRISETGVVVGGLLSKGIITEGDQLLLGPLVDGGYTAVRVLSMHRNRRACRVVRAGQAAALAIDRDVAGLRRGMVLLAQQTHPTACRYFQASVSALPRWQPMYARFQTTVHVGSVRQTAVVEGVCAAGGRLLPGQRASVLLRFLRQPEHVNVGDRLLFRQGRARGYGVGTVTQVFPCKVATSLTGEGPRKESAQRQHTPQKVPQGPDAPQRQQRPHRGKERRAGSQGVPGRRHVSQAIPQRQDGSQSVPHRQEGPQTVPQRQEGPQSVPHRQEGPQTVPHRLGSQAVPQRQEGPQAVPHTLEGPQAVPHTLEGPQAVPQRQEGPQAVPQRQQGPQAVPHRLEGPQAVPQRQEGPQIVPHILEGEQAVTQRQEDPQAVPQRQEGSQAVQQKQESAQAVPHRQERPQAVQRKQEGAQAVPQKQEDLQSVPQRRNGPQAVPPRQEGSQTIQQRQEGLQALPQGQEFTQLTSHRKEGLQAISRKQEKEGLQQLVPERQKRRQAARETQERRQQDVRNKLVRSVTAQPKRGHQPHWVSQSQQEPETAHLEVNNNHIPYSAHLPRQGIVLAEQVVPQNATPPPSTLPKQQSVPVHQVPERLQVVPPHLQVQLARPQELAVQAEMIPVAGY